MGSSDRQPLPWPELCAFAGILPTPQQHLAMLGPKGEEVVHAHVATILQRLRETGALAKRPASAVQSAAQPARSVRQMHSGPALWCSSY